MESYIKYKRFEKQITEENIDNFLEELIRGGWQIIYYNETIKVINEQPYGSTIPEERLFSIVVLAGKTPNQIKNVL
jgi:hypothetical protein